MTMRCFITSTLCAFTLPLLAPGASVQTAPAETVNAPVTAESLKRGLILDFDFDQPVFDGRIPDLSGNGNDGHVVGVQWTAEGHRGGGMIFGPTNNYITVLNNQGLNPPQFTLVAWIKTSFQDKTWRRIFDKSWDHGFDITMGGDDPGKSYQGQVMMEVAGAAAVVREKVTDGRWHQVVGTFNEKQLVFYLDGKKAGNARGKQQPAPTMYDLTIGANRSNPPEQIGPSYVGVMDDVMMFNRALSAEEVQALFTSQGGVLADLPAPAAAVPDQPDPITNLSDLDSRPVLDTLKLAYEAIGAGKRDYLGHRGSAMEEIEAAAKLLGTDIGHKVPRAGDDQAKSNARLALAQRMLERVRIRLTAQGQTKVVEHVDKAIAEIVKALKIGAVQDDKS